MQLTSKYYLEEFQTLELNVNAIIQRTISCLQFDIRNKKDIVFSTTTGPGTGFPSQQIAVNHLHGTFSKCVKESSFGVSHLML